MASSFAAGAGADMLQKILVQKALESMQKAKLAEEMRQADMANQIQQGQLGLGQQRLGLDTQKLGEDTRQFDVSAGQRDKQIGMQGEELGLKKAEQPYRLRQMSAETADIEGRPQREQQQRDFVTQRDKTQHGYTLGEIGARTSGDLRVVGARLAGQQAMRRGAAGDVGNAYGEERSLRMRDMINDILPNVGRMTVGIGSTMAGVPETPARNMRAKLEALKANVGFKELQEMRNASKTGGALGQVSDRENALLGAALGSLDQGQSPAQMTATLKKIQGSLDRWEAAKMKYGGGATPPAAGAKPSAADLIKKYGGQ